MLPSGTVVPMATPTVGRSSQIDVATIERFTRRLVDSGVHGLFPGSSIGEFSSFTREQRHLLVETVAGVAAGETTVMAGCGDTSIDGVVENVDAVAAVGADAAVVVTPYYLDTTQDGLEQFFATVADRSSLPVLLYNIPALTGHHLEVETVASLATRPGIIGLKDTSGSLTYHHRVIAETPPEFTVYQGATELAVPSLDLGADGLVAGPANVFPEALVEFYEAYQARDHTGVHELAQTVVVPLVTAMDDIPTAAAIKYYVSLAGFDIGEPLRPLPTLDDAQRRRLRTAYEHVVEAIERPSTSR